MAPQAAAIYARISSDPDGTRMAITRQIEDCRAFAQRRRWQVADCYVDDDISAYSGRRRPEYERMLSDLGTGRVDGVIVYHLDRLHRRPRELEDFLDQCARAGVRDMACVTGEIDLATHDGQFHARILGAVSRKESDDKSRRISRKHLEIARAGRVSGGGARAYGYAEDRVTIVREEAAVIREMAQRILAGDSLRSVATDLNARGVPTVSGREWKSHVVRKILLSGRISGQREHHGEILGKAVWPGIIRPRQTLRLRALLGDPERRTKRVPRRYLLSSLLRCHACGHTMAARPIDDGRRRYVCAKAPGLPGCGGTFVMAEEIEGHIIEEVLGRLSSPRFEAAAGRRVGQDDARAAEAQRLVDEAHTRLEELAEVYGRGEITLREWQAARLPVTQRVEKAQVVLRRQTQTTALEAVLGQPGGVDAAFGALPLARKQAVVAAVMDHAEVGPAVRGLNRFDPSRVRPAWRT